LLRKHDDNDYEPYRKVGLFSFKHFKPEKFFNPQIAGLVK